MCFDRLYWPLLCSVSPLSRLADYYQTLKHELPVSSRCCPSRHPPALRLEQLLASYSHTYSDDVVVFLCSWVLIQNTLAPMLMCPDGSGGYTNVTIKGAGFTRRRQLLSHKPHLSSEPLVDRRDHLQAEVSLVEPNAKVGGRRILQKSGSAVTRMGANGFNISGCSVLMDDSKRVRHP